MRATNSNGSLHHSHRDGVLGEKAYGYHDFVPHRVGGVRLWHASVTPSAVPSHADRLNSWTRPIGRWCRYRSGRLSGQPISRTRNAPSASAGPISRPQPGPLSPWPNRKDVIYPKSGGKWPQESRKSEHRCPPPARHQYAVVPSRLSPCAKATTLVAPMVFRDKLYYAAVA